MGFIHSILDVLLKPRVLQQFFALFRKNAIIAWRNRRATALRILAPLFFLILALAVEKALEADNQASDDFDNAPSPSPEIIGDIPSCNDDLFIGDNNCIEFVYTPNNNPVVENIVGNITARNQGATISALGFPTSTDMNSYLFNNPDTVIGALTFTLYGAQVGFVLATNTTVKYFKSDFQNANTFVQLPLMKCTQREIARYYMTLDPATQAQAETFQFNQQIVPFAHPTINAGSVVGQVLGPFIFAACLFSFVIQLSAIVIEKELGLRQALNGMGMKDSAYWASWTMWEFTLAFVQANLMVIFGLIMQFDLFLNNSYGLLFFLFFLFLLAMNSFAIFITVFIRKTAVAVYLGFAIFIIGWIMQIVVLFGVPYSPDYFWDVGSAITIIFSFFPWTLLTKGFDDLGRATADSDMPGITWDERNSYCQYVENEAWQAPYNPREEYIDYDCVMPLGEIYWIFVVQWLGYLALGIYCDNIWPNEQGVRKPLWYFLLPSYWLPRPKSAVTALAHVAENKDPAPLPEGPDDEDVAAEKAKMMALMNHRTGGGGGLAGQADDVNHNAIELFNLRKEYKGYTGACGCCGCFGCKNKCCMYGEFWAIRGSWFAIEQNTLFCLLGPNGAGKTTTINCLTGAVPPTGGDALVCGESITCAGGMSRVRSLMGVCPQFDVLWPELNGKEHLEIYGAVKGVPWRDVKRQAADLLEKVKLTYAAKQRSSAYSGGMKRRLSVAIALLGDPKVVFLDEPTTGMDPISRRYVWDIIQDAKAGRAIVLTTHSMEEADILGDRIAIMARGQLRCIGTSLRLKQKFGSGYKVAVSVQEVNVGGLSSRDLAGQAARADKVKDFFKKYLGLDPVDESKAYISYLVGKDQEQQLAGFLAELERRSGELGVTDIQMSLTSLEEVFLNIAKQAEIAAAQASGRGTTELQLEDVTVQVPLGDEWVTHPTTQQIYHLKWATDEAGRLVIQEARLTVSPPPQLPYAMPSFPPTGPYPSSPPRTGSPSDSARGAIPAYHNGMSGTMPSFPPQGGPYQAPYQQTAAAPGGYSSNGVQMVQR